MSVRSTVYTTLMAATGFTTLATGGLFPVQLPDNASLPAAVYQIITDQVTASGKAGTFDEYLVQVSCMAASIDTAHSMAAAVIATSFAQGWPARIAAELKNDDGTFYLVAVEIKLFKGV